MGRNDLLQELTAATGLRATAVRPLSGGCIAEVYGVTLEDGRKGVVKRAAAGMGTLDIEGEMLSYLRAHSPLPVPTVWHATPDLLLMEWLPGASSFSDAAEAHAAELLAALHGVTAPAFGFERDTLIGPLRQPNPWTDSWVTFFAERRLLHMGEEALRAGRLPRETWRRLIALSKRLDDFLAPPAAPALLHGDVWTTNVLAQAGRVTAFLDPAIYYGHPEIELAFTTLFNTFGEGFYRRYHELRPIVPGFFEQRRDLYNLYPLLVHVRLFGGGYLVPIERTLTTFGF